MKNSFIVLFLLLTTTITAQVNCEKYKNNYIPIDLNDAITFFECVWSKDVLDKFKRKDEDTATSELHFGTGMSIRNSWKLWAGTSELSKYFRDLGIHHPDDMSGIIFNSLHRKLNKKPLELEKQVKYYQDYWAKVKIDEEKRKQEELKRNKIEFNDYKIGDLVEFNYEYDYVSESQEKKWWNDECIAKGIIEDLNKKNLEIKIKLIESCDEKGIIIEKYYIVEEKNGKYVSTRKERIEIMKVGESRWSSFKLWETAE